MRPAASKRVRRRVAIVVVLERASVDRNPSAVRGIWRIAPPGLIRSAGTCDPVKGSYDSAIDLVNRAHAPESAQPPQRHGRSNRSPSFAPDGVTPNTSEPVWPTRHRAGDTETAGRSRTHGVPSRCRHPRQKLAASGAQRPHRGDGGAKSSMNPAQASRVARHRATAVATVADQSRAFLGKRPIRSPRPAGIVATYFVDC